MDAGYEVTSRTNVGQFCWILKPCLFEVLVKNVLSVSVQHSTRDHIHFHVFLLESQQLVLDILYQLVLWSRLSELVVFFREGDLNHIFGCLRDLLIVSQNDIDSFFLFLSI